MVKYKNSAEMQTFVSYIYKQRQIPQNNTQQPYLSWPDSENNGICRLCTWVMFFEVHRHFVERYIIMHETHKHRHAHIFVYMCVFLCRLRLATFTGLQIKDILISVVNGFLFLFQILSFFRLWNLFICLFIRFIFILVTQYFRII